MAMTQKERTQLLGLLIALGVGAPTGFWAYWRNPKVEEARQVQFQIDSLQARIDTARAVLAEGTLEQLRTMVEQFEGALDVMRELVPAQNEVVSLIDSVASRAQRRRVQLVRMDELPPEFIAPFQVIRNQITVLGPYDEIGEFLSDIASLRRIMVPDGLSLQVAQDADLQGILVEQGRTYLRATFTIRTFVKAAPDDIAEAIGETS